MARILADTSVWIDCFRDENCELARFIRPHILADEVQYNGVVMAELLQGCRDKKEYGKVANALSALSFLEFNFDIWQFAGEISFSLRKNGNTIPLPDCLIASQCIKEDLLLVTKDKHFTTIQTLYPVRVSDGAS